MDVDKGLREAVHAVSKQVAEQVSFSTALEERIRKEMKKQKKSRRKTAMMGGTIAACLVATIWIGQQQGMFTMDGTHASQTPSSEQINRQKANVSAKEAFAPLFSAVPELEGLRLEERGGVSDIKQVALLNGDRYEGEFAYNTTTGQIQWYRFEKGEAGKGELPVLEAAEQKAIIFLASVIGEESNQYIFKSAGELTDKGMRNGSWINVSFQKEQEGARVPFDIISVQIDSKGQVAFFGRTSKEEQELLGKLTKSLPELNPSPSLDNKSMYYGGFELMLGGADDDLNQAFISVSGKAEDFRTYRLIPEVGSWKEAPEALAKEKASRFLEEVLGADSKNYRLSYKNDSIEYQRYDNEFPVKNDTIRISVNQAGRIINYSKEAMKKHEMATFPETGSGTFLSGEIKKQGR
ncbi:hypothetical protein [Brevibacillus reuszeri]|uniref:hypothetical protein n=1 Tax=Brevibacillus reuszeri TaxID=54915 RepID=UPI00289E8E94|nr:hypothetical protein [Brevibacillus reuszeri]